MTNVSKIRATIMAAAVLVVVGPLPAGAAIVGLLELPDGFVSGASNIQGWAYTTTPGAKLSSQFDVFINGELAMTIPCCSGRGDVKDAHPEAPVQTGFSGIYNWGLVATAPVPVSVPEGMSLSPQALVEVVVTDDMGGSRTLSTTVDVFHPTPWPFSKLAQWKGPEIVPLGGPETAAAVMPPLLDADCTLLNAGYYTAGSAQILCTNLVFTAPDDSTSTCAAVYFSWDRGSQSFKMTSECIAPVKE
jgi:hypothetical protein